MKKIVIFGGTGFLGKNLAFHLAGDYSIMAVSRNTGSLTPSHPYIQMIPWDYSDITAIKPFLEDSYAVINLTGENISAGRWTKVRKEKLTASRINTTITIITVLNNLNTPPEVFVQGSAIGYYRFKCKEDNSENAENGTGFLSDLVRKWEAATEKLDSRIRKIIIRTGVVTGSESAFIRKVSAPFRMRFGGHIGSGKQWISWIHIEDEIRAIRFLMERNTAAGVYNLVAPTPLTMRDFAKETGKSMGRRSWFHVPGFFLKLLYGQMAKEIMLNGSRVLPSRLTNENFVFSFPEISESFEPIPGYRADT